MYGTFKRRSEEKKLLGLGSSRLGGRAPPEYLVLTIRVCSPARNWFISLSDNNIWNTLFKGSLSYLIGKVQKGIQRKIKKGKKNLMLVIVH